MTTLPRGTLRDSARESITAFANAKCSGEVSDKRAEAFTTVNTAEAVTQPSLADVHVLDNSTGGGGGLGGGDGKGGDGGGAGDGGGSGGGGGLGTMHISDLQQLAKQNFFIQ